jgi:transcriptional regulator with GAF, ATPase, and Fis domain
MSKNTSINQKLIQNICQEKERFELILSSINTGLALISPDMTLVWANDIIKELFPEANYDGKKCFAVAENRTTPCEGCQAVLTFKDGEIHEREFQNKQNKRWYKVVALPVKDKGGRVIYVLEASSDIDDRIKLEKKRDQALKELEVLKSKLEEENLYLKSEICEARLFSDIIGTSNALQYVLTRVQQVAATDSTVLILGETGVGKELVARAIHDNSPRSGKPFISINCAALPSNLVESELFGHERGAFTGALLQRKGRFELANSGTLFLDEISELPLESQAKLLGVLQDGKFERVGGTRTLKSDARIIAATNRELNKELENGRFRTDLYYRLNVYPITVPPLRKRTEDIPLLTKHFINIFNKRFSKNITEMAPSTMDNLLRYGWPGNIRELRNVIERAMITSKEPTLVIPETLGSEPQFSGPVEVTGVQDDLRLLPLEEIERRHIRSALEVTGWRVSGHNGAASILKMHPSTLRSRMKKMGLQKPRN